jgi:hypothetical protein
VQVNRPGVLLRFRRGYVAGPPPAPKKGSDPLMTLATGVVANAGLALKLTATPLLARTAVALEVTEPREGLIGTDGAVRDSLRYTVIAVDLSNGKIVRQFTNSAEASAEWKPGDPITPADSAGTVSFQLPVDLPLPMGRFQLRASATSNTLGTGGSVYLTVEVPDTRTQPLALSGVLIGYADGARVPIGTTAAGAVTTGKAEVLTLFKAAAAARPGDALSPTLDREFVATDTLRIYCELSIRRQPTGPAPPNTGAMPKTTASIDIPASGTVRTTIAIVDSRDKVITSSSQQVEATAKNLDQKVPLKGLTPGAYRIRVTATDGAAKAVKEVGFVIK